LRYAYYARRKLAVTAHGLRPSALLGRISGPRVLVTSIPKSGTHLVERALLSFPGLRHCGRRTLSAWDTLEPETWSALARIRPGQFALAHLPAFAELSPWLDEAGIRTLFVIRDPRDVLVSYSRYVTELERSHPAHAHFAALPDDAARLLAAIEGMAGVVAPIDELLRRYAGWLEPGRALVVRFEELVGPRGGGDAVRQLESVRSIAAFLGLDLPDRRLATIAERSFSTRSSTFHSGQTQGWRAQFSAEHLEAFNARAGELLPRYGYDGGAAC
jgi:hypothetical protein